MKKERGAITIITLTTILFMLAFLISTFVIVANRRQAQAEIKGETKKIYEEDVDNVEQIYADYFSSGEIPIATVEDLFKIATDEYIVDGEKIYKCTADANYKLMSNIEFEVNDYLSEYPSLFEETTYTENVYEIENYATKNSEENPYYTYTASKAGEYKLEVWGAQGGDGKSSSGLVNGGGKGGYSVGTISLSEGDELYIYVGGQGKRAAGSGIEIAGGYNGGGAIYNNETYTCGSGGGATDIRIGGNSYNHRVIVAGGGGGNLGNYDRTYTAGVGGGESGEDGDIVFGGDTDEGKQGKGGTQTQGGASFGNYAKAGFGFGAYFVSGVEYKYNICGGGGGWYGGGAGWPAGGGSGFVWTSETASNVPGRIFC